MTKDVTRLKIILLNSGLQQKDNSLYQVINQIIDFMGDMTDQINVISSSSSGSSTTRDFEPYISTKTP